MCEKCGCNPLARSKVYEFISAAFSYPDAALVELLKSRLPDTESGVSLLEDRLSFEALQALKPAISSPSPGKLETEYVQTFGHAISKECPPYEAEYGQSHIFQQSQTLADIAGFYRAFGLDVAPDFKDRLDHISVELEFMHFLSLKEAYALTKGHPEERLALCREAQAKFLGEHLGQWVPGFEERLREKAEGSFYALLGGLLRTFLTLETQRMELEPAKVRRALSIQAPEDQEPECGECPLLAPTLEPSSIVRGEWP